jgi:rhodanese-related sulfurtransferase
MVMSIHIHVDAEVLEDKEMVIVDIRTEGEWHETGIVDGCECITFFNDFGQYDAESFLKQLEALGGKEQKIGLICRTGARTSQVANFLHSQGYNVRNLVGGVMKLIQEGYELVPYKK